MRLRVFVCRLPRPATSVNPAGRQQCSHRAIHEPTPPAIPYRSNSSGPASQSVGTAHQPPTSSLKKRDLNRGKKAKDGLLLPNSSTRSRRCHERSGVSNGSDDFALWGITHVLIVWSRKSRRSSLTDATSYRRMRTCVGRPCSDLRQSEHYFPLAGYASRGITFAGSFATEDRFRPAVLHPRYSGLRRPQS